ncbi:MAG: WD40/YVTN/BNR-like repeat-containing protein [Dehalococcoidia bacterium]
MNEAELRAAQQRLYLLEHSDQSGQARPDLWLAGKQQTGQMDIATNLRNARIIPHGQGPNIAAGIPTSAAWQQIGPQPLRIDANQNFQGQGPDSGEVVDIAIDPTGPTDQIVYIATNDGGIWKTTTGGASWSPMTESMPSLSMGAVVLDPSNSSIVYAGTGNLFDGGGTFSKGVGIYRSTDGGNTWTIVGGNQFFNVGINRIVMPASNILLVATQGGLFRSIDGGQNFGSNAPNFNNGAAIVGGNITDLKLDTATASTAYAAIAGTGILVSTDSGATFPGASNLFTAINGGPAAGSYGFAAFAQSRNPNNQTMYALLQTPIDATHDRATLYQSTNTGGNWTVKPAATPPSALDGNSGSGCQCGYDQTLGVDPQDATRVYIGFQELYRSTDSAGSFNNVTLNKVHWDNHAIYFSPSSHWGGAPTQVWTGTDGGVSSSSDGANNWTDLNETIATNIFQGIDIGRGSAANNGYTYGGTQDTGIIEHRPAFAGNDWHLGIDGDGGPAAVAATNPLQAYAADDSGFVKTNDAGATWTGSSGFPSCVPNTGVGCVFRPAVDPNNGGNVYALVDKRLFMSTDTGANFASIHTFSATIFAIATTPANSNVLWVGLTNGKVASTANALAGAGSSWTEFTVTGAPALVVGALAIDPTNTQTVVVTYEGFTGIGIANRTQHVFRTTNNGTNWTDISGTDGGNPARNLPDLPTHSVVIDASTSVHTIVVSNDAGVMVSFDVGATWYVLGTGLPLVDSKSLALDGSASPPVLRLGTYGRSAWQLNIPASDTIPPVVTVTFPAPNGANGWYVTNPVTGSVDANDMTTGDSNITAINCTGATVGVISGLGTNHATAPLTVTGDGVHSVSCTATDSAGNTGASPGSTAMPILIQIDTTPPTIACSVSPTVLSPVNNTMRNIQVTLGQTDATSGPNGFTLTRVYSADGPPAGDISGFVAGTAYGVGTTTVNGQMRAAVSPGNHGRSYQLTFASFDVAGNQTSCTVAVQVRLR